MSLIIFLNFVSPSFAHAYHPEPVDNTYLNDYQISKLASELKFYFKDVGEIDRNGNYIIINPKLLESEAKNNEYTKELYESYLFYEGVNISGVEEFGKCVLNDQLAWIFDAIDGNTWKALGEAIATHAWNTAGKILAKALSYASEVAGASVGIAFSATSLALSAYNCRSFW